MVFAFALSHGAHHAVASFSIAHQIGVLVDATGAGQGLEQGDIGAQPKQPGSLDLAEHADLDPPLRHVEGKVEVGRFPAVRVDCDSEARQFEEGLLDVLVGQHDLEQRVSDVDRGGLISSTTWSW